MSQIQNQKFTHKFGDKTLSVTYYEDKRLKKLAGIKQKMHPIYLRIIFNKVTIQVRSILWQRLTEGRNEFTFSTFINKERTEILEGYTDVETSFFNDKEAFYNLCEYEFECIKRIIVYSFRSNPKNVQEIIKAYNLLGQDGLREICTNFIKKIIDEKDDDVKRTRLLSMRKYPPITKNLSNFLKDSIINYDPVSVFCLIDEIDLLKTLKIKGQLLEDFKRISWFIQTLSFAETKWPLENAISFTINYFPKIHFFYPLSKDFSPRNEYESGIIDTIKVIDLLQFKSYLSK